MPLLCSPGGVLGSRKPEARSQPQLPQPFLWGISPGLGELQGEPRGNSQGMGRPRFCVLRFSCPSTLLWPGPVWTL